MKNASAKSPHRYPPDKPCPPQVLRVPGRKTRHGLRWWRKRCHSRRSRAWHREECREVLSGRHVDIEAEAEIRADMLDWDPALEHDGPLLRNV